MKSNGNMNKKLKEDKKLSNDFEGNLSLKKIMHSEMENINLSYIPKIKAIVPPLTPGTASAIPINRPLRKMKKLNFSLFSIFNSIIIYFRSYSYLRC